MKKPKVRRHDGIALGMMLSILLMLAGYGFARDGNPGWAKGFIIAGAVLVIATLFFR